MKSTFFGLTTLLLTIGVTAEENQVIPLLPPPCGIDVLIKAAKGASCINDRISLTVKKVGK